MIKAAEDLVDWPIRASEGPLDQTQQWSLSLAKGAQAVRWRGSQLQGSGELERFNPNIDTSNNLWPSTFRFSPLTGEVLRPALPLLPPTGGRLGSLAGLPSLEVPEQTLDPSKPRREELPRGEFYFAQGGTPGFLFAADLKSGTVFRKRRLDDGWANHGRYPRSSLEPWAIGLAGTRDAIYYSGDDCLVRLNEDPENDGAEKWPMTQPVSAPAALENGVVAPAFEERTLKVAWLELKCDLKWLSVSNGDHASVESQLASPCIGPGEIVYWIGRKGFLDFELTRSGGEAAWRPWPSEFVALPYLRPYRAANGGLWAFGLVDFESRGGRAAVAELSVGGVTRLVRQLEGPHASASETTYRNKQRFHRPWSDPIEEVQTGLDMPDCWLLPLVSLPGGDVVVALVSEAATMRAFLFREGIPRARQARLFLHRPNGGIVSMNHSLDLTSTDEIDLFPTDGRLCLYHREENKCVSWPLV